MSDIDVLEYKYIQFFSSSFHIFVGLYLISYLNMSYTNVEHRIKAYYNVNQIIGWQKLQVF